VGEFLTEFLTSIKDAHCDPVVGIMSRTLSAWGLAMSSAI
jgi:hypothetical protein